MDRLIEGQPMRSDGKLTIKSLADEAGVKRWMLTHKHTDLQDEFKVRLEATSGEPAVVVKLREQLKERDETITRLRAEIRGLTNDRQQLERVINVLSVEQQHGRVDKSNVVGVRGPRDSH
ncbi:hypothetical protein RN04_01940 [Arthrobacter sp. W1]|nr:hypothetical protein RN04_01940 [Arthrobacter sp. W1]